MVGELALVTDRVPFYKLEKNWYKLDREDAARLYIYRSIPATTDYAIEEELRNGAAEHLGLNDTVSENIIERISEEVEKQLGGDVSTEIQEVVEELEVNDEIVTLPEPTADGRVEPLLVLISRELPTKVVGRIERETEKTILLVDTVAARPLKKLAHRIHELEQNENDPERNDWLAGLLTEHRRAFEN